MDLEQCTVETLKCGIESTEWGYRCLVCGQVFEHGEVFPLDGRWFTAQRAAREHVKAKHPALIEHYAVSQRRYMTLTPNQRDILWRIEQGCTDQEIARSLGLSPSTVRHQRFTFREKAKQAKLYLALYSLAMEGRAQALPANALEGDKVIIQQYDMTQAEYDKAIKNMFSSMEPLRLSLISPKEKKRVACLYRIAQEFEADRRYTEKEVNAILTPIYDDFTTLRRDLVEHGFLGREKNGSAYWLIVPEAAE